MEQPGDGISPGQIQTCCAQSGEGVKVNNEISITGRSRPALFIVGWV